MKAPSKIQKSWREFLRSCGSAISYRVPCEIHHPAGRTAKEGRVPIGHWFLIALTPEEHQLIDEGADGLTELMDRYEIWHPNNEVDIWDMSLHQFEKFIFFERVDQQHEPFGKDVTEAIYAWQR